MQHGLSMAYSGWILLRRSPDTIAGPAVPHEPSRASVVESGE